MLFFVDETWQTINGREVGALGGVAFKREHYNAFCSEVYKIKREELLASELTDSEVKGQTAFSRAAFKRHELHGDSHWLLTIDRFLAALARRGGRTFVIWTRHPQHLTLRHLTTTLLSEPYKQLLFDFRAYAKSLGDHRLGVVNFDQRDLRQDEAAACTVQNFFVRTGGDWRQHFVQVPTFTASSTSPGLQAADIVAYLGAHQFDPLARPELKPYTDKVWARRFQFPLRGKTVGTIREVY